MGNNEKIPNFSYVEINLLINNGFKIYPEGTIYPEGWENDSHYPCYKKNNDNGKIQRYGKIPIYWNSENESLILMNKHYKYISKIHDTVKDIITENRADSILALSGIADELFLE